MKNEKCYNIYTIYIPNSNIICGISFVPHILNGSDGNKIKELQKNVENDFKNCENVFILNGNDAKKVNTAKLINNKFFTEEIFNIIEKHGNIKVGNNPIFVITPIHNGEISYRRTILM